MHSDPNLTLVFPPGLCPVHTQQRQTVNEATWCVQKLHNLPHIAPKCPSALQEKVHLKSHFPHLTDASSEGKMPTQGFFLTFSHVLTDV